MLLLSEDIDNGASQGSCVDIEDFVDAQGYDCIGNKDVNCSAEETFTSWGYSRDEWQDVMQNCPASCRLCPGKMSMNGIWTVFRFSQYIFHKCKVNAPCLFVISFRARGGIPIFGHVRGHRGVCRQSRTRLQQQHRIRLSRRSAVYGRIWLLSQGLARYVGELSRKLWPV
jgi:hypothetical protein